MGSCGCEDCMLPERKGQGEQVQDGVLLDGKLEEYQRAFQLVDTTGNGTLGAGEIAQLFKALGQPLSPTKLFKIMEQYDGDGTGRCHPSKLLPPGEIYMSSDPGPMICSVMGRVIWT